MTEMVAGGPRPVPRIDRLTASVVAAGAVVWWLGYAHPAQTPAWMPWDFSWFEFLALTLPFAWYWRGLAGRPRAHRPPRWRQASFVVGIVSLYAALLTHFDYYSQHMFFLHRTQHLVLHHMGPFLLGLSAAGPVIEAGMPASARRLVNSKAVVKAYCAIQHPVLAPTLFVGLIALWLIPAVHFRAMLDSYLYDVMNASMALDGVLFWALVLDSRRKPPALLGSGGRVVLALIVVPPQIVIGSILALINTDLYPVYALCGRILPMTAINDQHYGGLIIWIPAAMMSLAGMLAALTVMRLNEEKDERNRAALSAGPV